MLLFFTDNVRSMFVSATLLVYQAVWQISKEKPHQPAPRSAPNSTCLEKSQPKWLGQATPVKLRLRKTVHSQTEIRACVPSQMRAAPTGGGKGRSAP